MIVPCCPHPSQIQILPSKALRMNIFAYMFSKILPGVTPRTPFTGGWTPPQTPPLSLLHCSTLALRASAQSLQYLVRPFPTLLQKSGKSQEISFGLECGHLEYSGRNSHMAIVSNGKGPLILGDPLGLWGGKFLPDRFHALHTNQDSFIQGQPSKQLQLLCV